MTHADYALVFKAMADETRLKIIMMLSGGELCACKILESFQITQPTLSYHMKILCDSGLVEGRRDGAWMRYSLKRDELNEIGNLLNAINKAEVQDSGPDCC